VAHLFKNEFLRLLLNSVWQAHS